MKATRQGGLSRRTTNTLNQALLSAFLEHVPDLVYFKDRECRFIKASSSLARRIGVSSAGELVGKSDDDFYTEETASRTKRDELGILKTGEPVLNKLGKQIWYDGRVTWQLTSKVPTLRPASERRIQPFPCGHDINLQAIDRERILLVNGDYHASPLSREITSAPHTLQFPLSIKGCEVCTDLDG